MIARDVLARPAIADEVAAGLLRRPKSLPPKLFYDQAGSALFERITRLPEYYLTRTETAILRAAAGEIAATPVASLVELGAGTSTKTRVLIAALLQRVPDLAFFPVDISAAPVRAAEVALRRQFPTLRHQAIIADFLDDLSFLQNTPAPRLVLYLGSSIGNFEPMPAVAFLARVRRALSPGDFLLIGADMRKSPDVLLPAYDDAQGVTAAFNKNVLARINRELGGHFDLDAFRHVARWNAEESRMEMHLEARRQQSVRIDLLDLTVDFRRGERIHTENSYKYSDAMFDAMLRNAGFTLTRTWSDPRGWFRDFLAGVER